MRSAFLILLLASATAFAETAYKVRYVIADEPGIARRTDPNLINPWGLIIRPRGNFMVANAGIGVANVYKLHGLPQRTIGPIPAVTGVTQNQGPDFVFTDGLHSLPARAIYVTETGLILAWNPDLNQTNAFVVVDNSASNAVYKGVARADTGNTEYLYAANFHAGVVEMYNSSFQFIKSFTGPDIPAGFAPFNVRNIRDRIFVTYAKQLAPDNVDDEPGAGNGYVDIFDLNGNYVRRLVSNDVLNSPWGIVRAPEHFGTFSDAILIGNFGDGRLHAYNPDNGNYLGTLRHNNGDPIVIDGLWALTFGVRSVAFQDPFGCFCDEATIDIPTLYFTAGPGDEAHGLFGFIRPRFFFLP